MFRIPLGPVLLVSLAGIASGQTAPAPASLTIDLPQAITRARQYAGQLQSANLTLALATEDRVQTRAARLPQVSGVSQYIYTEPNGSASGVFVANNGVHVFTDQALVHQDVMPLVRHGDEQRALAAEAVARAKVDVASRGINAVVIQNYYAIAAATRKLENAALNLSEARQFVDITEKQESGGEVAHADVIKARFQLQQRQVDLSEAQSILDKAKIALAVLIFPDYQTAFNIKDDLDEKDILPPLPEARSQTMATSPDIKAANAVITQSGYEVNIARYGYFPTVSLDFLYGLNANELKLHDADGQRNLGAGAQISVDIPIWNWGSTKSKVKQAELRQAQARLDLSLMQRASEAAIATAHREAQAAFSQVTFLREAESYANESLRLTLLRYQAGESTAFEVADAQSTVKQARDAFDDGLARYRAALATLRTLMGTL